MDLQTSLGGMAGFAIIGTVLGMVLRGWSSIRGFFKSFFGIFVIKINMDDDQTSQAVLAHLIKTFKHSNMGEKTFGGRHDTFRSGKFGYIPYEFFGGHNIIFWKGWVPFWFNVTIDKTDEKGLICWGNKPKPTVKSSIFFIRYTIDIEKIVKAASVERNKLYWASGINTHKRFFIKRVPDSTESGRQRFSAGTSLAWYQEGVYRLLANSSDELGKCSSMSKKPIDNLFFPSHVTDLIHEVEMWRRLQTWYNERAIPWKRGWLLYGPPGTGKTAIARAIAEELDMPLFVYALGQLMNDDLEKSWAEMQAHIPCVALFEDFDNVFHGRDNIYGKPTIKDAIISNAANTNTTAVAAATSAMQQGQLSFDCVLNCMDGVEKSNGIFTVITTNHIEKIDPAIGQPRTNEDGTVEFISTRPGRIDKAIELTYMTVDDKLKLAQRILFDNENHYLLMREKIEAEPDRKETPAQFQERCAQFALEMLWKSEHAQSNGRHKVLA